MHYSQKEFALLSEVGNYKDNIDDYCFALESQLSASEKYSFILHYAGEEGVKVGYFDYLMEMLKNHQVFLPKNDCGCVTCDALLEWIEEHDVQHQLFHQYFPGGFKVFGRCYNILYDCSLRAEYYGQPLIHEWFHLCLVELYKQEEQIAKEVHKTIMEGKATQQKLC